MPRARTVKTEEDVVVAPKKRAPRKRVSVSDGEAVPRVRAPRKRVSAPESVEREEDSAPVVETARRAPTPLRAERTASVKSRRMLFVILFIFVAVSGIGVVIGLSDGGPIDVVAVVNERNERINRGEVRDGENTITVPVQNSDVRPNGGLVPADADALPPPNPEPEVSSGDLASTTENGVSSSTVETNDDDVAPPDSVDAPPDIDAEESIDV